MQEWWKRYGQFITEEDKAILTLVHDFTENEIMPVRKELDEDKNRAIFGHIMQGMVKLGMQKRVFPERMGGLGIRSAVTFNTIHEEISRGDSGIAMVSVIPSWVFSPAITVRNEVVLQNLGTPFCQDEYRSACMGLTEPEGGCNVEAVDPKVRKISTTARLKGNEWVITGTKRWPSEAGVADVYLIVCTTDPEHQSDEGIALIYVPAGTPGLSFGKPENKMGMGYTDINADIYLDEVRVPKEYRVAGAGEDYLLLRHILSWGRLVSAPNALGNAQAVFESVVDYTGNRFYAGKQVREHSLQASIIADMAIAIESARAYYLMVSSMFDNRKLYGDHSSDFLLAKASAAKIYATDVTVKVCNMAMELMGSYGYSKDFHVEKYLRDSKIIQLWAGGSHAARIDVARGYYPMR